MSEEKPVPIEVMENEPAKPEGTSIHPMAAGVLIVMDGLWTIPELAQLWIPVMIGSVLTVLPVTYLIQRHIRGDLPGPALAKAAFLALLAAVPTPIVGTATGLLVLGMAGLHKLRQRN